MSRENAEVVERAVEVLNGGSPRQVFELGLAAPDARWHGAREYDQGRTYVGADGFAEFMATWTETFEAWSIRLTEVREVGDRVVAYAHQQAVGKGSGIEVAMEFAMVFTLRDGQIAETHTFLDRNEAGAAAESSLGGPAPAESPG